jgi:hypothetical protein
LKIAILAIFSIIFAIFRELYKLVATYYIFLTTTSKSLKKNIKTLEKEIKNIINLRKKNTISFNIDKIELIYFNNSKNKPSLKLPNRELVSSSKVVK